MAGSSLLRLQSDERLVALVRDGHDPAFTAVVDRYRAELLRYCTRLVGDGRAEDVVQQALLNAHTALVASENDINLRPWLYRIAHNAGLNVLRSSREAVELDERLAAPGGVERDVETRERLAEALVAIARLPEPQRDALTLRVLEGRSHAEIADSLGVSPGAARQHLHRARSTVRAAVSALTPYGLMARFAMAEGGDAASSSLLGGAGVTAGLAKVGAGVLAAGAIATGTTGHVPFTGKHGDDKAAAAVEDRSDARPGATAAAEVASRPATGKGRPATSGSGHGSGRGGEDQRGDDQGGGDRSGRSSGSGGGDDRSGTDDRKSSGSGGGDDRSGSGSGDDRSGSGDGTPSREGRTGSSGSSGTGSSGGSDDDLASPEPVVAQDDRSGSGGDDLLDHSGSSDSGTSGSGSSDSGSSGSDDDSPEIDG